MDEVDYRAIIKYLFLKGNASTQIKYVLDSVYGDFAPTFTTVKFWAAEFKRGRKNLGDEERSGRPNTAITDKTIAKVHQMVLDYHGMRLLTLDQKRVRMNIFNALLAQFRRQLFTVDGTWIHHYTPEIKTQSKPRTTKGEPALRKSKICFFGWESEDVCFLG
ncbi:histone-lysine N-methyltransferase SETMAR [Trichonephila clavipes]|nr:histone-lysine N-methyltransferase SETMAR [Trichonephila clavipes]